MLALTTAATITMTLIFIALVCGMVNSHTKDMPMTAILSVFAAIIALSWISVYATQPAVAVEAAKPSGWVMKSKRHEDMTFTNEEEAMKAAVQYYGKLTPIYGGVK